MRMRLLYFTLLLFFLSPSMIHAATMDKILNTLEASLTDETDQFQNLEKTQTRQKEEAARLQEELRDIRLLLASGQNLLLTPNASAQDLEKTRASQAASLATLETRLRSVTQHLDELQQTRLRTEERMKIVTEQASTLKAEETNQDPRIQNAREKIEELTDLLKKKQILIDENAKIAEEQIKNFSEIQTEIVAFSEKLQEAQQVRKATELFERKGNITGLVRPSNFFPALAQIRDNFLKLFEPSFWQEETAPLLEASPSLIFRIVLFALLLIPISFRARFYFVRLRSDYQKNWRGVFFEMASKSVVLLVLAIFAELLCQTQNVLAGTNFFKMLTNLFWALAVYRVITTLLKAFKGENRPGLTEKQSQVLKDLTRVFGIFVPILIFSTWLMGPDHPLITVERIVMEIFVVFIVFRFWGKIPSEEKKQKKLSGNILRIFTKAIALGAPLLELFGYGPLALFWFWGWGISILGFAFYFMLLAVIREWAQDPDRQSKEGPEKRLSLNDLGIKMLPTLLLPIPILSLTLAWGVEESILPSAVEILTYPVIIGSMKFSIFNFFKAICALLVILLMNYGLAFFLEKRVFNKSGMEKGLQSSILTLLSYLFWGIGILFALHILGLNATSLAVVFGAMSVGLGFGLQNIFNNFVSGIILLFERPIQVGDVIEIDGVMGKVTKINVRSTVVQTYDNASFIVPNANFMTSKLVNWSFKDKRVRKNVDVGVAYGTDVKEVEKLLLEIAGNIPGILRYPAPDVVFRSFGDSSLDFRLRFWASLDVAAGAENKVRLAIAVEFDKAGIEIPFPQQDIHIRSDFRIPAGNGILPESREPEKSS